MSGPPRGIATVLSVAVAGAVVVLGLSGCAEDAERSRPNGPSASTTALAEVGEEQQLLAVGDIAACDSSGDEATASLLDAHTGQVATLGDNVYDLGTPEEFANCFEPSWGRHKARIRPAPGNHDYGTAGARGYYDYFGAAAGTPGEGWYSYDVGTWHVIVINSVCAPVGGCHAGSPQEQWLRADLAAHSAARCTIAYWHHPRFSSGLHGSDPSMAAIWQAIYDGGVDIALAGHDHHYERFVPLDPNGAVDNARGVRQFIVGTGGNVTYPVGKRLPGSEASFTGGYGVLRLMLGEDRYRWDFLGVDGVDYTDSGEGRCH